MNSVNSFIDIYGNSFPIPLRFRSIAVLATPIQIGTITGMNIYGYNFINPNASDVFVKIYSSAASPSVGADTPTETFQVAGNGSVVLYGTDIMFQLALKGWIAATTESADSGTTAPGSALICSINYR